MRVFYVRLGGRVTENTVLKRTKLRSKKKFSENRCKARLLSLTGLCKSGLGLKIVGTRGQLRYYADKAIVPLIVKFMRASLPSIIPKLCQTRLLCLQVAVSVELPVFPFMNLLC